MYFLNIIFATVFCGILALPGNCDTSTLELVHVLFRHGDRTLDRVSTYPKDPYINETYYPFGLGQLTNKGKVREYRIGKALRKRYNDFLGSDYTPAILDAVSSNFNRTKMSLQLVLAGLFPPHSTLLEWERELNWQPIPYNYLPSTDHLLTFALYNCLNYAALYQDYLNSVDGAEILQKHAELFEYLSENTGLNVTSLVDIFLLYAGLESEEEWGFKLPSWTESVYPEGIQEAVIDHYLVGSATTPLKQLSGGFLLDKILKDTSMKVRNELKPEGRKIFLYAGHDFSIGYLLNAMEVYFPHIPPYGAYVLIEVHQIHGVYGVKIFYQDYSQEEPQLLTVPGCDDFCPVEQFVETVKKNVPVGDNPCLSYMPV